MRGDLGVKNATTLELRHLENSDESRLVVDKDGVEIKIDLTPTLVFGLMDECLDVLVERDGVLDTCESCDGEGTHAHNCVLVATLKDALRALMARGE